MKKKKKNGPKIVMVGGGSYNWCPRLLCDIMQTPELEGSELVLLDPKKDAAKEVKAAGETIAKTLKKDFNIVTSVNEASAFDGADFVLITISTGDLPMMDHDLKIPEKYGIFQPVGDTVGPGGWSRSLRNVPVFVKMAQKIEKYSNRAVVLNYTNPMSTLTAAIHQSSSLRAVGLCHGVFGNYRILEKLFNVKEEDLRVKFGGVNHFFWIIDFTVKGEPGYPLLKKRLGNQTLDEILREGETDEIGFHSNHTLCYELYKEYGYLPYVGDRHICEFLPGFLTPKQSVLKKFNLKRTSVKERYKGRRNARKRAFDLASGKLEPYPQSRETAVDIIKAIYLQKPFIDVVNLPNIGQIDNLPRGAVVETLGVTDSLGFTPMTVGSLPDTVRQLVEPHCHVQKMTLKAAIEGDKELALQALMLDPICAHLAPSEIREMGIELMKATKDWLPQF